MINGLVIVFLIGSLSVASNAGVDVDQLKNSIDVSKARIVGADIKERKVLGLLYSLNTKMKKMNKKRDQLTDRVFVANSRAKNTAKGIAELEEKITNQRHQLSKRLRALYKLGDSGVLPILFSTTSSHELEITLNHLKSISDEDYKNIVSFEKSLRRLTAKRKKLKGQIKKLVRHQKSLSHQEQLLEKEEKSKYAILKRLKTSREKELAQLKRIREKSKSLDDSAKEHTIADLLNSSFFENKGKLKKPVKGRVIEGFGLRQEPVYNYKLRNKGLTFSVAKGTLVETVHAGEVAFAGRLEGYGNTVIVDHGDHYFTVYSYLGKLFVERGQSLISRQPIASATEAMVLDEHRVHFEIRHFSDAVNPSHWLLTSNK